jgi:hypothetical protein
MEFIDAKPVKLKFSPFRVEIEIETEEEARLLYHVLNRDDLKECIFSDGYGGSLDFIMKIDNSLDCEELCDYIESKAKIWKNK